MLTQPHTSSKNIWKAAFSACLFFPGKLHVILYSPLLPPLWAAQGMGNGDFGQSVTHPLSYSFPLMLCPCFSARSLLCAEAPSGHTICSTMWPSTGWISSLPPSSPNSVFALLFHAVFFTSSACLVFLSLNTFPHRHHHLSCCLQLCPTVCPASACYCQHLAPAPSATWRFLWLALQLLRVT